MSHDEPNTNSNLSVYLLSKDIFLKKLTYFFCLPPGGCSKETSTHFLHPKLFKRDIDVAFSRSDMLCTRRGQRKLLVRLPETCYDHWLSQLTVY